MKGISQSRVALLDRLVVKGLAATLAGELLLQAITLAGAHCAGGHKKLGIAPTGRRFSKMYMEGLMNLPQKKCDSWPDTKLFLSALIKA